MYIVQYSWLIIHFIIWVASKIVISCFISTKAAQLIYMNKKKNISKGKYACRNAKVPKGFSPLLNTRWTKERNPVLEMLFFSTIV